MNKIMIIEDDMNVRDELFILLRNAGYNVVDVKDFTTVMEQFSRHMPDVVLLDIELPNRDGYAICVDIRRESNVPIIFITGRDNTMDELKALSLGGDDFISKPYNIPVLMARISAVLRRNINNEKDIIDVRGARLNISKCELEFESNKIELTKNECKILYCLCKEQEKIVSRAEIIEFLWDNQVYVDDNTLSVNITRLRDKLKTINCGDLIQTKRGMGYKI